ncbi:MAG TPA: prenyltransferase [Frankiaceae bacterium]|nr:prenyltransferase [Frankiaceae bacterium]
MTVSDAEGGAGTRRPGRLASWQYALTTTNPPRGVPVDELDGVTRWLVVTRAAVLPMTLGAGLVAGLLAIGANGFSWFDLVLAVVGILAAHLANNLMNDLFDTSVGTDTGTYPRALYAPHPILSGLVTKRTLLTAILATNVVDLVILIVLTARRGWPVVAFALAGFLLSYAYTAPPLRLKKIGLGEPDVLIVWGPLMIGGTYFSATGSLPWQVLVASIPYGLLCTTVLMGKHVDKIPYDAPAGTNTLPVLLGERRARRLTLGMMVAFYVVVALGVAIGALPWPALLALLGIERLVRAWPYMTRPRPAEPPKDFPVWPLWYAAVAFVHLRRPVALLVLGLALGAMFGVRSFD